MQHRNNKINAPVICTIADVAPNVTDEQLNAADPEDTQRHHPDKLYVTVNYKVRRLAEARAFFPYVTKNGLSKAGRELIEKQRSTKCARKSCTNNLGQEYAWGTAKKFDPDTMHDLEDRKVLERSVNYGYEQIVPDYTARGEKLEVTNREGLYDWQRLGYCGSDCHSVQERANANKKAPIPEALKRAMRDAGFTYNNGSRKNTAIWDGGPNATTVVFDRDEDCIYLTGIGLYEGKVRRIRIGKYTSGEVSKLIADVKATKPEEYYAAKEEALKQVSPAEKAGLKSFIACTERTLTQLRKDAKRFRAVILKSTDDPAFVGVASAQLIATDAQIVALGRSLDAAQRRLLNEGTYYTLPENTVLPMLLTDEQRAAVKDSDEYQKQIAKFAPVAQKEAS